MKRIKTYEIASFKALDDEGPGKFQAVVSVFGNVDLQGDRVMPGAFKNTLKAKRASGDPIPVIWSHDWLNPDAHIGWVDPEDAVEITGDEKAGGAKGGLLVKGTIEVHKPFAAQVFDLLKSRRVKEWSFSYDIVHEDKASDGANELKDLDLHEVGPCLKGANPETYTVSAKSALESELKEAYDMDRSMSRFIDLIKSVDDPEISTMLTKTWTEGPAEAVKVEPISRMSEEELQQHIKSLEGALEEETPTPRPAVMVEYGDQKFEVDPEALTLVEGEKDTEGKPWHIEQRDGQYCVIKDSDSSTVACHDTEEEAQAQLRALYANESSEEPEEAKVDETEVDDTVSVTGLELVTTSTSNTSGSASVTVSHQNVTDPATMLKDALNRAVDEFVKAVGGEPQTKEEPAVEDDPDADIKARLAALYEGDN